MNMYIHIVMSQKKEFSQTNEYGVWSIDTAGNVTIRTEDGTAKLVQREVCKLCNVKAVPPTIVKLLCASKKITTKT